MNGAARRGSARARMSAACRRSRTPSTTPSPSWAALISRCRTTTGATGGRRRAWVSWRSGMGADTSVPAMTLSRDQIAARLADAGYIADGELATAIALMQLLKRALPLEGEAGGGTTTGPHSPYLGHAAPLTITQLLKWIAQTIPCH